MILADLVKDVSYGNSKKATKYAEEVKEQVQQFETTTTQFMEMVKSYGDYSQTREISSSIQGLIEQFNKKLKDDRANVDFLDMKIANPISRIQLTSNGSLFSHSLYAPEILKAPRAKMENIVEVAEKLGLLIIPTEYVNQSIIERDRYADSNGNSRYVSNVFSRFVSQAKQNNLNSWLVCPIQYYDIEAHAKDLTYEFFVPSSIRQAFTSIKIILPMLIGMINQIESISKKVDNMSSELNNIRQTLVQQQQQIDRLQEELTQQRIRMAEQAAREREMEKQLQEARARIQWEIFDPMLIAVPSKITNINNYNGNVVLGPAWGPEIDKVLMDLLGLEPQERKNYIATEANRYYS